MSETFEAPAEQLPGYTLIDRLGVGGYGEVWRASAPGGLTKAVKYVFGRQEETRATHEMKALERIKEVRHPFLLSLERIEVVDGRLIVVTELADGSLRDRVYACQKEGKPGIPRDELLGYLRDAADALDFLTTQHDLQHLDIKPENLLLLAGHVKVADFGLVKSISNQTQSLVGGMTPTYAAPEVFQGRPSNNSDQYSLAIMYQELLTGVMPFHGANAAELTLQHLNEEPDLASLSEHDRYVISRALSKDPNYRFDNCVDMVQALVKGPASLESGGDGGSGVSAAANRRISKPTLETAAKSQSATEVFDAEDDALWGKSQSPILMELAPLEGPPLRDAETPVVATAGHQPSPAVFIGIGGSAGKVLRNLRQRLTDHYNLPESLPTLPMLLLDTDAKSLLAATRGADKGEGLTRQETIAVPLRRPQEYRDKSPQLLRWLGRRWMYNIPRSLQTEGIRPLGRLALVDHARQTFQRIRRTMTDAISEESLALAEQKTGTKFQSGKLRIYVCASISGGTGSGMALDVAYAVKSILKRLDLQEAQVIGVLTHSASRDSRRGELARVNAYSWLSEYQHFTRPGAAYPGDEGCGLPAHEPGQLAFDDAYLVDMGAGLDSIAFENATQTVADYLYLDSTTAAGKVLDACRATPVGEARLAPLRTFSLSRREVVANEVLQQAATETLDRLLADWIGDEFDITASGGDTSKLSTNPLVHGAPQLVGQLRLDSAGLASLSRSLLEASLGNSPEATVEQWNAASQSSGQTSGDPQAIVDTLFGFHVGNQTDGPRCLAPTAMGARPLADLVQPLTEKLTSDLRRWIVTRVDVPGERTSGARRAVGWFGDHLRAVQNDLTRLAATSTQQLGEWLTETAAVNWQTVDAAAIDAARLKKLRHLIDLAAIQAAASIVEDLLTGVEAAEQQVIAIQRKLHAMRSDQRDGAADETQLPELVAERLPQLVKELEERIECDLFASAICLTTVVLDESGSAHFGQGLARMAEQVAIKCLSRSVTADEQHGDNQFQCEPPALAQFGGVARRFAVRPEKTMQETSAETTAWPEIAGPEGDSFYVVETESLSLPHVAAEIVGRRRDYAEFAERVHTRQDIRWTNPQQPAPAPSATIPTPAPEPQSAPLSSVVCTQAIPENAE